ncbi:uncharacterized protein Z518_02216 [Rhinocladiella mackenziei CBS 650.93]|uniref:Rhinocladiella mackenziei CBS 650.93 unplaced genomic scaffold supercont1.2, whole genome shotgun sequence n=1 Tax=Rhinocladiella mackenziei CBS 650.93 TaxID=1442369 RepID=A0A0D2HAU9_9EURO|nr:uncharacterized protein Z518_02216 [Rhinocladiella mackenziei CBS 650.93]KIX07563.1 hypothetical protein Z518_02216 [Rhinocladiella mackenziei CBS 650.93]
MPKYLQILEKEFRADVTDMTDQRSIEISELLSQQTVSGFHPWVEGVPQHRDLISCSKQRMRPLRFPSYPQRRLRNRTKRIFKPKSNPPDCSGNFSSAPNVWAPELQKTGTDDPWKTGQTLRGCTLFIQTNWSDRSLPRMENQNPAYRHGETAMPRGMYTADTDFWASTVQSNTVAIDRTHTYCRPANSPPYIPERSGDT